MVVEPSYFRQGTSGDSPPGPDGDGRLFTAHFRVKDEPLALETLQFNIYEYEMTKPDGSLILASLGNSVLILCDYCNEGLYGTGCVEGDRFTYLAMADMENVIEACDPDAYHDFSDVFINVLQGVDYELIMEVSFGNQYVSAWIDLNDNVAFEESEKVLDGFYIDLEGVREQTVISILNDFPPGEHRLRLRTVWNNDLVDPCEIYSYGETQDYTINIFPNDQFAQIEGFVFDAQTLDPVLSALPQVNESGAQDELSQNGFFSFIVEAGSYSLSCSAPGYATANTDPVLINPGEVFTNDFYLEHATCSENLFEYGCSDGDGINDFFFNHIQHPASGCSGDGYGDFTDMKTILACGSTYACEVTTGYDQQYLSIWIDMNDNYVFEPEELVLENAFLELPGELYSFDVNLPPDCAPGEHIMRARMNYADQINDPCSFANYGEVHEYTVEIFSINDMGSIQGTVFNWDNDFPQSDIEIFIPELGISTFSDVSGNYDFGLVPGGTGNLNVYQEGYFAQSTAMEIFPPGQTIQDMIVKPVHQNYFDFPEGWSGLSSVFYVNRNAQEVFGSNEDKFVIISSQNGFYYPGENVNTLNQWEDSPGYMIKASEAFNFEYPGWTRKPAELNVPAGWSILPGWNNCPVLISDVFDLAGNPQPVIVKEIGGSNVFWPGMGINTLSHLYPNKAYLAYLESEGMAHFPGCGFITSQVQDTPALVNNTSWPTPTATSGSHLIHISASFIADAGLSPADYLGAFDAEGNCFGLTQIPGTGDMAVAAFADDITTGEKDGFVTGEIIYIKAFVSESGEQKALEVDFDQAMPHERFFAPEGISSALLKSIGIAMDGGQAASARVYPNPATGSVTVSVADGADISSVSIYDIHGQLIRKQDFTPAGEEVAVRFDLSGFSPGIYTVKAVSHGKIYEEKLIIQ